MPGGPEGYDHDGRQLVVFTMINTFMTRMTLKIDGGEPLA
jgi:hypothetical protein